MRLGIFGGSFDPVHNGHLALARACQSQAALNEVWFLPTAVQPLKRGGPQASDAERIEMLELAIADEPSWKICRLEIDRGGLSYTVDTLRQIHAERPDDLLFFLMGADAVRDVPRWKEPFEIFRLATAVIVERAGESPPDSALLRLVSYLQERPLIVEMPPVNVSSTEIRRRAAAGESNDTQLPAGVARYVAERGVYR